MGHVFGLDEGVEFFAGEVAEFDGGFAEAGFFMVSGGERLWRRCRSRFWGRGR